MKKTLLLAVCVACFAALAAGPAEAGQKKITVGHIQASGQAIDAGVVAFKEYVEKASNGNIAVEVFPNSQLGDALTQISSVRMGTLTAFVDGVGWYGQLLGDYYLPATAYAIKNWDAYNEIMYGEIGDEMAEQLRRSFGLRVIRQDWARLPRNVLAKRPIRNIGDLQGLKLRVPELKSYIVPWRDMGASPTPIAFAEVYLALQQGVAEGLECPIDTMYLQRLHEVAKYLIRTRHQMESANFVMNDAFYNGLTAEEKKIVEDGVKAGRDRNNAVTADLEADIEQKMQAEGVTIIDVDVNEFYQRAKNAPEQLEADGTWTKGLAARAAAINAKH